MKIHVPIMTFLGGLVCALVFTSPAHAQNIDFGKSYVNITKGLNGGTVEPGDTLEIRASIVIKAGTYDSCAYFDVIPTGTSYIPGTIRVLTNEGKIYKQFTDAINDDEGWINGTNIRINLGYVQTDAPATRYRRGRLRNGYVGAAGTTPLYKPSFFKGTCIQAASFRVKVTASYNTTISIGGGSMTYFPVGGRLTTFNFPGRTVIVYKNYGICPNAVGANALGTEFNGTFGSGRPRNRGTSANVPVGYTYSPFTSNMPNDYYYGISNNTSINTGYTVLNSWPKPDNVHRVFGVWDIIGDHTGAVNPVLGNPAADTVANANGGYMLVINAAYRIDSAFQQTISNLCPNTYYEIAVWMRNICSRCGCDSNGVGAGSAGYIPTAVQDSSGVYPNLSFNVNGVDYYSSGNILYTGNWIKKGFTFLTGPAQTSFTLKVFNNAPGGGGNDWALDDISVATCSPNLAFTPTNNPTACDGNTVDFGAYVRSFFNNYTFYKWQKSTDNGATWADAGPVGTGNPVWNGTDWEYFTAYPTFVANAADSGTKYRVVVSSTAGNINDANCSFADVASILTLNVIECGVPLVTDILSFSAKRQDNVSLLNWTTNKEDQPVNYTIERSTNGQTFTPIASISGQNTPLDIHYYNWSENYSGSATVYYRIRLTAPNRQKISRMVRLFTQNDGLTFGNIENPFKDKLIVDVNAPFNGLVYLQLIDNTGRTLRQQQCAVTPGSNLISVENTRTLPKGMYTIILHHQQTTISRKLVKQ
ncbi:MAG TPA: T9SS type A sorting domain-containing protein [Flavisolibacter sp.]|nr:T9SS type A sorting domain-containing protein [Flavisolibacter sp.]